MLQDQEKRKASELIFKNEQLAEAKRRKQVEEAGSREGAAQAARTVDEKPTRSIHLNAYDDDDEQDNGKPSKADRAPS